MVLSLNLYRPFLDLYLHASFDLSDDPLILLSDLPLEPLLDLSADSLLDLPGQLLPELALDPPAYLLPQPRVQVRLPLPPQGLQALTPDKLFLVGQLGLHGGLQGLQPRVEDKVLLFADVVQLLLEYLLAVRPFRLQQLLQRRLKLMSQLLSQLLTDRPRVFLFVGLLQVGGKPVFHFFCDGGLEVG